VPIAQAYFPEKSTKRLKSATAGEIILYRIVNPVINLCRLNKLGQFNSTFWLKIRPVQVRLYASPPLPGQSFGRQVGLTRFRDHYMTPPSGNSISITMLKFPNHGA
jgi:hypothetical protein